MNLSRTILLLLLLAGAGRGLAVEPVIQDFSSSGDAGQIGRNAEIKDGVLKLKGWPVARWDLTPFNGPVHIRFRLKPLRALHEKNFHYGFNLYSRTGTRALFYAANGRIDAHLLKQEGDSERRIAAAWIPTGMKTGIQNGQWAEFDISVGREVVSVMINGTRCLTARFPMIPLAAFSFHSYNHELEVDDLLIEPVVEKEAAVALEPLFAADFNRNLDAVTLRGTVSPVRKGRAEPVQDADGGAVRLTGSTLNYPFQAELSPRQGAIQFRVRSVDGRGGEILRLSDGAGDRVRFSLRQDSLSAVIAQKRDPHGLLFQRAVPGDGGDWVLITLVWKPDQTTRLFFNALPYVVDFKPGQRAPDMVDPAFDGIKQLILGGEGDLVIDDVRLWRRPLSNREVYETYRKTMPLDMVMEETLFDETRDAEPVVRVAPGGFFTRPLPVAAPASIPAEAEFQLTLLRNGDSRPLCETTIRKMIEKPEEIRLAPIRLPFGSYTLICNILRDGTRHRKSFPILSARAPAARRMAEAADVSAGKLLFEKNLTSAADPAVFSEGATHAGGGGRYLEAGSGKGDRFCFEISFPREQLGKPVLLDITWPDDKPRSMGFYMYGNGIWANRDRLQSGVQAGREYPESGELQTTRHLFYPGVETYLFEARTMAKEMPAAVAKVRVYALAEEELPRLALREPEGLPGRKFGFVDEDQTFNNNLGIDRANRRSPRYREWQTHYNSMTAFVLDETIRYFDYVGMNRFYCPYWRYASGSANVEGHTGNGLFPFRQGDMPYILKRFADAGMEFITALQYSTLPEGANATKIDRDFRKEGILLENRYGELSNENGLGRFTVDPSAPETLSLLGRHLFDTVDYFRRYPSYGGLFWWGGLEGWPNLNEGYGAATARRFTRDTGIALPEAPADRYRQLTGPLRREWINWRASVTEQFIRAVRKGLTAAGGNVPLLLQVPLEPAAREEHGLDLEAIARIPDIQLMIRRSPTRYRHGFHWGTEELPDNEQMYRYDDPVLVKLRRSGKLHGVFAFYTYFETYVSPVAAMAKRYPTVFEDADVKPHGRWFLREFAFDVGAMDALEIVSGGQVLSPVGREAEVREFARAYRALPAMKFHDVPGLTDPVVARFLTTKNGTYFYCVNMFHEPVAVELDAGREFTKTDLSTGDRSSGCKIELKPFELRSFLVPEEKLQFRKITLISVGPRAEKIYAQRLKILRQAVAKLRARVLDTGREQRIIEQISRHMKRNEWCEVWRLAFSRAMNQLLHNVSEVEHLVSRERMLKANRIAINCGGTIYVPGRNGDVFFPDQPFDGKFGWIGRRSAVIRAVNKPLEFHRLYESEAYDVDGYRFRLPPGSYRLRLYMKCGFPKDSKPDYFVFDILGNGRMLAKNFDLFVACKEDFDQATVLEYPVRIEADGSFELTFRTDGKHYPSARLINGLEIFPE